MAPASRAPETYPGFVGALAVTLGNESGYANDPADHGGPTNYGVTQATYDAFRDAVHLPRQPVARISDPEVRRIYLGFWLDARCDLLAAEFPGCVRAVFDAAINSGGGTARRHFQRAVGAVEDGVLGPLTLAKARALGDRVVERRFLTVRDTFYRQLAAEKAGQAKFLPSWLARVRRFVRLDRLPTDPLDGTPIR